VIAAMPAPVRRAVRAGGFVAVTAGMLPPFVARLAAAKGEDRRLVRDRWVRTWSRALLSLFSVSVEVRGLGALGGESAGRGRLVVANHRSTIDVAVLLHTFGGRMVSRADLSRWPVRRRVRSGRSSSIGATR
jgi:1-acyl-sn-glycerol-3-phosphate acyltransferase